MARLAVLAAARAAAVLVVREPQIKGMRARLVMLAAVVVEAVAAPAAQVAQVKHRLRLAALVVRESLTIRLLARVAAAARLPQEVRLVWARLAVVRVVLMAGPTRRLAQPTPVAVAAVGLTTRHL